jgi:hypothetical protein
MKTNSLALTSLILAIITVCPCVHALVINEYWVSTTGNDSNDGSQARPWRTIVHADANLQLGPGGTVVHVLPGSYSGRFGTHRSGTSDQYIIFKSEVKWGAKITGYWRVQGAYQKIVDFEMTGPNDDTAVTCYIGQINGTAHHCQIIGNYIHDIGISQCASSAAVGTAGEAGGAHPAADAERGYNVVSGNIIRRVGAVAGAPNNCNQFHGIYASGPYDVISNNIISGVIGWGIHSRGDIKGQVISNNTIFNNSHGGIIMEGVGPYYPYPDYMTVLNNIVVNNGDSNGSPGFGIIYYQNPSGPTHLLFSNNLLYGNQPANWSFGVTPTWGGAPCPDPCYDSQMKTGSNATVFVNFQSDWNTAPAANYNSDNYALRSGSPAIDKGTTLCVSGGLSPCVPSVDIDGTARPQGTSYDIGAFEFAPNGPAPVPSSTPVTFVMHNGTDGSLAWIEALTSVSGVVSVAMFLDGKFNNLEQFVPWEFYIIPPGSPVSAGNHILEAIAYDSAGSQVQTGKVSFTIPEVSPTPAPVPAPVPSADTTSPTVTITSPENGAVVQRKSTATLFGQSSDNTARVLK